MIRGYVREGGHKVYVEISGCNVEVNHDALVCEMHDEVPWLCCTYTDGFPDLLERFRDLREIVTALRADDPPGVSASRARVKFVVEDA